VITPVPLTVLPPLPKVGGRVRLALGAPSAAGSLAFVVVRSQGAPLGVVLGAPLARFELPVPDDVSLAGRTLQLRAGIHDPVTGLVRWSDELEIVLGR
jgi:hypothetical protein